VIGGFAIGAAAVASQPEYGGGGCFGVVFGGDFDGNVVYGGVASGEQGIVFGGDAATGVVFGGDGRTDC